MEDVEQQPMRGLASQRPMSTPPDTDSTEDRRVRDSRNHRPFPSRETNQRWHSHHPHDGPPSLPPVDPYRWTPLNTDGQWRRPPRSEVQEDSRSRYAPQEDSRSRYAPQEDSRSRRPRSRDRMDIVVEQLRPQRDSMKLQLKVLV
ncbi:hypothetical protein EYF80_044868 [Liparis tanakae]|uniref:Uncharacterized protein n=1 Tax=Liparis tanakae TaxID=230148 RepID=A0A4Z2FVU1_9TELE|nr:hypothetical protein EYF80_044868 [Liparis tanakae]